MKVMFNAQNDSTVFWVITNTIMTSLLKETVPEVNVLYGGDLLEIKKMLAVISVEVVFHLKGKNLNDLNIFLNVSKIVLMFLKII